MYWFGSQSDTRTDKTYPKLLDQNRNTITCIMATHAEPIVMVAVQKKKKDENNYTETDGLCLMSSCNDFQLYTLSMVENLHKVCVITA